ncbi:MAG: GNAT family N-acetyltransferase [Paracoccaceae bacterium]|nr:GNAT family N-acetyltransferase [Paracoccaceae bacterium]
MSDQKLKLEIMTSLGNVHPEDWDSCACPEVSDGGRPNDPFTTYRFLKALEDSGSVGTGTGWDPCYIMAYQGDELIGCAPMYRKMHSQGEYIFDHNWAHAFERAGGMYYPKLQIAVPFTPATGRRFLVKPHVADIARQTLIQGALQFGAQNNMSSVHITFCTKHERELAQSSELLARVTQQFHWENNGYKNFDQFLTSLSSRKRKNIRKERAKAVNFGGEIVTLTGDQIQPKHWDAFYIFYQDTGARKWGHPYLTRRFFDHAQDFLRDEIALVMAKRDGRYVAGAVNFIGRNALYGRYWGCVEDHPCLHFEVCYYQAIDFAISQRLDRVEAGAQGEHKLARGYMPRETHSLHWMADASFQDAVSNYLEAEKKAVAEDIEILTNYGPFRKITVEEQE